MYYSERSITTPVPEHIIAIGGGGCHIDRGTSIPFRMARAEAEDNGINYHPVHGCTDDIDSLKVTPPSLQKERIAELVDSVPSNEKILLMSQCMGGLALVGYLNSNPDKENVRGVIFAPATRPPLVVEHKVSKQRRTNNDTVMNLNWLGSDPRDFVIGDKTQVVQAELPPEYLSEAKQATDTLGDMYMQVKKGRLALVAAALDWNQGSLQDVQTMQQALPDHHSQLLIIGGARHSLNTPDCIEPNEDKRIQDQLERTRIMLQAGYGLFKSAEVENSKVLDMAWHR